MRTTMYATTTIHTTTVSHNVNNDSYPSHGHNDDYHISRNSNNADWVPLVQTYAYLLRSTPFQDTDGTITEAALLDVRLNDFRQGFLTINKYFKGYRCKHDETVWSVQSTNST